MLRDLTFIIECCTWLGLWFLCFFFPFLLLIPQSVRAVPKDQMEKATPFLCLGDKDKGDRDDLPMILCLEKKTTILILKSNDINI